MDSWLTVATIALPSPSSKSTPSQPLLPLSTPACHQEESLLNPNRSTHHESERPSHTADTISTLLRYLENNQRAAHEITPRRNTKSPQGHSSFTTILLVRVYRTIKSYLREHVFSIFVFYSANLSIKQCRSCL